MSYIHRESANGTVLTRTTAQGANATRAAAMLPLATCPSSWAADHPDTYARVPTLTYTTKGAQYTKLTSRY